jgi:hypothetical protein
MAEDFGEDPYDYESGDADEGCDDDMDDGLHENTAHSAGVPIDPWKPLNQYWEPEFELLASTQLPEVLRRFEGYCKMGRVASGARSCIRDTLEDHTRSLIVRARGAVGAERQRLQRQAQLFKGITNKCARQCQDCTDREFAAEERRHGETLDPAPAEYATREDGEKTAVLVPFKKTMNVPVQSSEAIQPRPKQSKYAAKAIARLQSLDAPPSTSVSPADPLDPTDPPSL